MQQIQENAKFKIFDPWQTHQNMLALESTLGLRQVPDQTHLKLKGYSMIWIRLLEGG